MFILFETESGTIYEASILNIDVMGIAKTEREAMEWREKNPEYRTYKYTHNVKEGDDQ